MDFGRLVDIGGYWWILVDFGGLWWILADFAWLDTLVYRLWCILVYFGRLSMAVATGPAGPVLAGPVFTELRMRR